MTIFKINYDKLKSVAKQKKDGRWVIHKRLQDDDF